MDWNNNSKVWSRGESNARDLIATSFNVDRKNLANRNMLTDEPLDVFEIGFDPDFTRRASDIGVFLFLVDFG